MHLRGRLAHAGIAALACAGLAAAPARADLDTAVTLPYAQAWSDASLITVNDSWSGVQGVRGFLGDVDPGTPAVVDVDARTLLTDNTTVDVNANNATPNTFTTGGVTEFAIADPVVALQGSGTADAPNLVFRVDASGRQNLTLAFSARDIDGAADNAVQQLAVQYRVGPTGPFTRAGLTATEGYVADATTGPSLATLVTPVSVTLPDATDNASEVYLRVLTTNAFGSDEWVGVDDVAITSEASDSNQPVVTCGATLALDAGQAGTRQVSATDADGSVTALTLGAITPSGGGAITIGATSAETEGPTVPATATVSVANTLAAGTYSVPVIAENDGGTPGTCTLTVVVTDPNAATKISAIQGVTGTDPNTPTGYISPLNGQTVTIEGVVTGHDDENGSSNSNPSPGFPDDRGIFVQEEVSDADAQPRSSEGIFVGNVTNPLSYAIGSRVRVTGVVTEKFQFTQINVGGTQPTATGTPVLPGDVPVPVTIDEAAAEAQTTLAAEIPGDCSFPSDLCREGRRAYYETLEGMLVTLPVGVANSGGVNGFGEIFVTPGPELDPVLVADDPAGTTDPGVRALLGAINDAGAGNPLNPQVDQTSSTNFAIDHQDRVQNLRGPLTFAFGNYKVVPQVGAMPTVVKGPTTYPFSGVPAQPANTLRATFFNVENIFPPGASNDGETITQATFDEKVARVADAIDRLLKRPDVVGIEEIGDGPGTTSEQTLQAVATKLGGYTAYAEEGNDNRGIDVGFLIKTGVTLTGGDVIQIGKTATESIAGTSCSDIAGRLYDRPPLVARVVKAGVAFEAIVNHWASKAAPDSCRDAQADFLNEYVQALPAGTQAMVGGDLNAFEFETPLDRLQGNGTTLDNLIDKDALVPPAQRFSFHFGGRIQVLDHIVVTDGLAARVQDVRFAHFDNEYYDRNLLNAGLGCSGLMPPQACTDGHKVSDHDPPIVTLALPAPPAAPVVTDTDPDSPADDNAPRVKGTAAAGSAVKLYTGADCTGPVVATGTAAAFASPGLTVAVPDNSTTAVRATATSDVGASPCSSALTYVEQSTTTTSETTTTTTTTPSTPSTPTTPTTTQPTGTLPSPPVLAASFVSLKGVPKSVRVSRTGTFRLSYTATALRAGRIGVLATRRVRVGRKLRTVTVAARAFTASAKGAATTTFRLSAADLRALKRAKRLPVKVTAVLADKRATAIVVLKAP